MPERPPRPLIDFDPTTLDYARNWREIYAEIRPKCPVAFSQNFDGFWLISQYNEVLEVAKDAATYSSDNDPEGDRSGYRGVSIPESPKVPRSIPLELDPPELNAYRRMLHPLFAPSEAEKWTAFLRDVATALIDAKIEEGQIDLVLDLSNPLPTIWVLAFLGLPVTEWRRFAEPIHDFVWRLPGSPEKEHAFQGLLELEATIRSEVQARINNPQDDLITYFTQVEVNGERLDVEAITSLCYIIIEGGVDEVTSLFGTSAHWLSDHPEQRQRLIDDPSLIDSATEEFLRYFSPVQLIARTATKESVLGGQKICPHERVWISWAAANHDPAVFDHPEELVLDRSPNKHVAFGYGRHRCVGLYFGRLMFKVLLETVLTRIPDYEVDSERAQPYTAIHLYNGYGSLPAVFHPDKKLGSKFTL